jgi:ABC-2 type transport system permease protein
MKKIIRIARLELNILFYSPIAWFLLIVFLFQCGLAYTGVIKNMLVTQDLGGIRLQYLQYLTNEAFPGPSGLFSQVMGKFYLYLPLLTMGLMSREISSGTIKLLYSSPIRVREIIFGKFLAMMLYNLLLVAILAIFVVTALFNIQSPDAGILFSGLLGLYLLLCAYAAIGLFMSCLTSYQVVAALSTLVALGILSYVGTIWQDIDFVRDLTYFLSINGRTEHMLAGLITTKDILYFLVIIYMFLGFSIYKLQAGRESVSVWIKSGRYALIVVSALVIGYLGSRQGAIGYYDATANKTMTLTPNAQKILKETGDAPLEVTSYINLLENHYFYGTPSQRNRDMARWEPYLRFKSNIQFKYVYYYDSTYESYFYKYNPGNSLQQIARQYAKSTGVELKDFLSPREIRRIIDLRPEENRYVMQLEYQDKTTFLRLFNDQQVFPGETETSAAIKRMMVKLPRIVFLTGELERNIGKAGDRDYKTLTSEKSFRYALVNQGFDVDTVSLKGGDIPAGTSALVIADPRTDFEPAVLEKIRKYIADGGNLLIAGEPGKQSVLNPLLQPLGVQLTEGTMVQQSKDYSPDLVLPYLTPVAAGFSKTLAEESRDSGKVSMPGAAALSYIPGGAFDIQPLLMTDSKLTWDKQGGFVRDSAEITYSGGAGDVRGPLPTAVRLTRQVNGREQRIVITGDADFLSNGELKRIQQLQTANFYFNTAIFGWFSYGEFPIDASRPKSRDNRVRVTDGSMTVLKVLFMGVLPGLLLLAGTVLLIRRKRK